MEDEKRSDIIIHKLLSILVYGLIITVILFLVYTNIKSQYYNKNYTVDIWFEKHGIQEIIHIEDIYDAIHYQDKFTSIEEVKKFVESGGFENM